MDMRRASRLTLRVNTGLARVRADGTPGVAHAGALGPSGSVCRPGAQLGRDSRTAGTRRYSPPVGADRALVKMPETYVSTRRSETTSVSANRLVGATKETLRRYGPSEEVPR